MKVATASQMQKIDDYAINELGIPGIILMENAGLGVVKSILQHFPDSSRISIVCGKGNNGGDGFVVARHLHNKGKEVQVIIIGDKEKIKGDAKTNLDIIEKMGINLKEIRGEGDLRGLRMNLIHSHLIVDAIFGTGLDSAVRGIYAKAIDLVNNCDLPTISVDIPSGLCADHGKILGNTVKADYTITFGLPKRCHYLYPAANYVGELEIVDISFPKELELIERINVQRVCGGDLKQNLHPRPRDSHKGTFGHVLILGGSPGKTGAPIMAAEAALRCGAGLVTCGVPESLNPIFETQLIEAMTLPLKETTEKTLSYNCLEELNKFIKERKITAIAIGPGISTDNDTGKLVRGLIEETEIPIVLDADALNLLSQENDPSFLADSKAPRILTPHPGEMARLIKKEIQYIRDNPIEVSEEYARKNDLILTLKGAPTITASPDGRVFINSTGNPGLASGGSGDVLTGMIASFIGQIEDPLLASILAVYLHGLAGDFAASDKGEISTIATDVIDYIPEALVQLLNT